MTPKKLPFVRLTGRVLAGLSILSLFLTGSHMLVEVLPTWRPEWTTVLPTYKAVYADLPLELSARLPWLLLTWLSLTAMAFGIWLMGQWPHRTNLVRG